MTARLLEKLRDRVVHWSLIGKRKLDRTGTRRGLDDALRELGRRYRALVRAGQLQVPAELAGAMEAVAGLEGRLAEQEREIAELEMELPREA